MSSSDQAIRKGCLTLIMKQLPAVPSPGQGRRWRSERLPAHVRAYSASGPLDGCAKPFSIHRPESEKLQRTAGVHEPESCESMQRGS